MPGSAVSREYCSARSGGLERVQQMAERRLDGHGQKIEDLTRLCVQLTGAFDRVSVLLEKQDRRLEQLEKRRPFAFLESEGGKTMLRFLGIGLLILLCAGVGVNIFTILKEVA